MAAPYSQAFQVTRTSSHEYLVRIHEDFAYMKAAHGGSMISLLWEALAVHYRTTLTKYRQPDVLSCNVQFLRPAVVGEATVRVKDVQLGRAYSTVHASLEQGGKERVVAYFTNIDRANAMGMTIATGFHLDPPAPAIDFTVVRAGGDPIWVNFNRPYADSPKSRLLSNFHIARERTACADKSVMQQWIGWSSPASRWTTPSIGLACDLFLPAAENYIGSYRSAQGMADHAIEYERLGRSEQAWEWTLPYWYFTLSMSVEVKRALPEEGVEWLFTRMRTKEVTDGRLDVIGEVWDAEGRLVALTQQVWMIVDIPGGFAGTEKQEKSRSKI